MAPHKEKHYSNSRAHRHSSQVVIHSSRRTKKHRDGDVESISSTDTIIPPPPTQKKCPLRFILAGILDADNEDGKAGCPLRRVQLWHTIPLCVLAVINLLLIVIALLGLAGYRMVIAAKDFAINLAGNNLESYDNSPVVSSGTPSIASEKS
jgi:hypothetical protein